MRQLEIIQSKILDSDQLKTWLAYWNFKNFKIVFTNGCFDILHLGHIEYLAKASDYGDVLIVGLNTDNSVKKLKGLNRPLLDQLSRATLLASLRMVDAVVLFDEDTPFELIRLVQPDVLVKGSDYKAEEVVGYDIVTAKGGEVKTVKLTEGYSTTGIIDRMPK
ncbi:MAG: D-glycero-beta-D-manno-heptose 1-phosphate adenylyltransferase [Bacteroidales bacterium]|nr:D-glycero-beta-D-manno-heptose 1-phosphate adenylyltransferase [Bacteroidales bacterium]